MIASLFLWGYLALAAHADLLLPRERDEAEDQHRIWGFVGRLFLLGVLAFAIVTVVSMAIFVDGSVYKSYAFMSCFL